MSRLLILMLVSVLPSTIGRQPNPKAPTLVFKNVTVVDVTSGSLKPNLTVVVIGNRISDLGTKVKIPSDSLVIEANGKFLIPGLWDMHTHTLTQNRYEWVFSLLIANGVTGIRELGTSLSFEQINHIRREISEGRILGPRFGAVTEKILDGPGTGLTNAQTVATVHEARNLVKQYNRRRMDFIKTYDLLSRDVYLAIVDEAKRQKIPVAGHVPFSMTAWEVSDLGQVSIEHNTGITLSCSRDEDPLRQEMRELSKTLFGARARAPIQIKAAMTFDEQKAKALSARFVRNSTWMCPTLSVAPGVNAGKPATASRLKYIPAEMQKDWLNALKNFESSMKKFDPSGEGAKISYRKKIEIVGLMAREGVGFLAGSDLCAAYAFPGFSLHDELAMFVEAGLTPAEALRTATINPARFLGKEKELGSVEKEKLADLVLLDANPLEDIRNTTKIEGVVVDGRYLNKEALDKMLSDVEARHKESV